MHVILVLLGYRQYEAHKLIEHHCHKRSQTSTRRTYIPATQLTMKQLFIFIAFSITLGFTAGLPAPESKEVQVMDSSLEAGIDDSYIHKVESRAVSTCKLSLL